MHQEKDRRLNEITGPIVFLCILLVMAFYNVVNPTNISLKQTKWIETELTSKPVYKKDNGDGAPYMYFYIKGYDKKVDISGCALYRIDKEALLSLNQSDRLLLQVDAADLKSKRNPMIYSSIHVYGVKLRSGKTILSLERINRCEKENWKLYLKLATIPLLMLLWTFLSRWKKQKDTN